jgi:hypothetical protein
MVLACTAVAACGGDDSSSAAGDPGAANTDRGAASDRGMGFVDNGHGGVDPGKRDPGPAGTDPGALPTDPGKSSDPGAGKDPGAGSDPGGSTDPGAQVDPGGAQDPGGANDPGASEDTGVEGCEGPMTGEMIVNEWLLSPAQGATGDANCDGTRGGVDDEMLEFVNVTSRCLDISEATIATSSAGFGTPRYTFPAGTTVPPGGVVLVFGGDAPSFAGSSPSGEAFCTDLSGCEVQIFSAFPSSLAFKNSQEWVVVTSRFGIQICEARCAEGAAVECPAGESLTRTPEGTGAGDLVPHTSVSTNPQSPGRKADGGALKSSATCP